MKEKHIAAKIAFGVSTFVMVCVIISVVVGAFNVCREGTNSTPDEITTIDEVIVTEQVLTTICTESLTNAIDVDVAQPTIDKNESYYNNYASYSEYEYDLLARTIYQEGGVCSEYCQWLIGSAVLNLADERGGIENVVFDYNTFNVAYVLYDCTPSNLSYSVAERLLSGDRDYVVKYFRTDYYHGFGTPYTNVDNVYFSTN